MRDRATAEVCNANGPFDAAYDFGHGAELTGTQDEIGAALCHFLSGLARKDCEDMKYGTDKFFIRLTIVPEEE
jgi:hypothetical protein